MMFHFLLTFHSLIRWLVLAGLLGTPVWVLVGLRNNAKFSLLHYQAVMVMHRLIIFASLTGVGLYAVSPLTHYYLRHLSDGRQTTEVIYFSLVHSAIISSLPVLTGIGVFRVKKAKSDQDKFRYILWYFGAALILVLACIPWPFLPVIHRPLIR